MTKSFMRLVHLACLACSQAKKVAEIPNKDRQIYIDNPNLYQSISYKIGQQSQIGTVRELFFIKMFQC